MTKYVSYNDFKVFVKNGSNEYHDRRCPRLKDVVYQNRDYKPLSEIVNGVPCPHCCCAKFYFTQQNPEVANLLKKYKMELSFDKSGNVYTEYAGLFWKVVYSSEDGLLKVYNSNKPKGHMRYQYSCKHNVKKVIVYIGKFRTRVKDVARGKSSNSSLDNLFAQIELEGKQGKSESKRANSFCGQMNKAGAL